MSGQTSRETFYLLGCERCGHFAEAPSRFEPPDFTALIDEPLRCNDCGDTLLLAECFVADETAMWQAKSGATWRHVAFADRLPKRRGRRIWVSA